MGSGSSGEGGGSGVVDSWPEEEVTGQLPSLAPRILVVDDSAVVRRTVHRHLAGRGYVVQTAASGEEAFDVCLREPFDLLVSDVTMGTLSGMQLCRLLRSDPATAAMPIILLTAAGDPRSRFWGRHAGADEYLAKEAMAEQLLPAVERLLATRPRTRLDASGRSKVKPDPTRRLSEVLEQHLFEAVIVAEVRDLINHLDDRHTFAREVIRLTAEIVRYGYLVLRLDGPEGTSCAVHARETWPGSPEEQDFAALGISREEAETADLVVDGPTCSPGGQFEPGERVVFPIEARNERMGEIVAFGGRRHIAPDDRHTMTALAVELGVVVHSLFLVEETRRLARTDGLTGLANRRTAGERLEHEVKVAARASASLCVALCDVDDFKNFNDRFGHHAGDEVLRQVADRLAASVRAVDLVGRWGGEEFVVGLPGASEERGLRVAERLRAAVAAIEGAEGRPPVTISVGLATLREGESLHSVLERADRALYQAKERGRNRVESATD